VRVLSGNSDNPVMLRQLVERSRLDRTTLSRRVAEAIRLGYLRNIEDRSHQPHLLLIGEPLPNETEILPRPERLSASEGFASGRLAAD